MASITDLFKAETEFAVKASEMYAVMKEAAKAEFLLNAAECEVPHTYARQMATGIKEDAPSPIPDTIDISAGKYKVTEENVARAVTEGAGDALKDNPAAGHDVVSGSGSVGIIRKHEQRVEWIDIRQIIRNGNAPVSLPAGTEINFTLKDGSTAQVVVVGTNHYKENDCVFWFRKIVGRHCMNESNTNDEGFLVSDMREYLNNEFIDLLPDELQDVIAPHEMIQRIKGDLVESRDRLFLMTEYEGRGEVYFSEYNGRDKQFEFFKERRNRVAYDEDGDPVDYWTADPSSAHTTNFCLFSDYGHSNSLGASNTYGVAPLFVIE